MTVLVGREAELTGCWPSWLRVVRGAWCWLLIRGWARPRSCRPSWRPRPGSRSPRGRRDPSRPRARCVQRPGGPAVRRPACAVHALPAPQRTALRAALLLEDAGGRSTRGPWRRSARRHPRAPTGSGGPGGRRRALARRCDGPRPGPGPRPATRPADLRGGGDPTDGPAGDRVAPGMGHRRGRTSPADDGGAVPPRARAPRPRPRPGRAARRGGGVGWQPAARPRFARHHGTPGGSTFEHLLEERLGSLPRGTRLALLAAALAGTPTVELVAEVRGCAPLELLDVLEPAVQGRLVRVTDRGPSPTRSMPRRSSRPRRRRTAAPVTGDSPTSSRARRRGSPSRHRDDRSGRRAGADPRARGPARAAPRSLGLCGRADGAQRRADAAASGRWSGPWRRATGWSPSADPWRPRLLRPSAPPSGHPSYWEATIRLADLLIYLGRAEEARSWATLRTARLPPGLQARRS